MHLVFPSGHAIAQVVVTSLPLRQTEFQPKTGHVGFMVDKVALGKVFSKYFGFSCQSFHRLLQAHHHLAGTIGKIVAEVPSGLRLTPPQGTRGKENCFPCIYLYTKILISTN
jgi:hypothetical protein